MVRMFHSLKDKKALSLFSLALLLFGFSAANTWMFQSFEVAQSQGMNRKMASLSEELVPEWKHMMESGDHAQVIHKSLAPSLRDRFQFEHLKGKYQVFLQNDLIRKVSVDGEKPPENVGAMDRFLKVHGALFFGKPIQQVSPVAREQKDSSTEELFKVDDGTTKHHVLVTTDSKGHLLEMEVH